MTLIHQIKAAPKLNLHKELHKLKRDSVAVVEANKATTHLDVFLTAAPFGLFEEGYRGRDRGGRDSTE